MRVLRNAFVCIPPALLLASVAGADQAWPTSEADEVRALVAEMMSDAETRTSLLQSSAGAGHDGHFFIGDSSGNFRLQVEGQLQFRYMATIRDDDDAAGEDDFESGFTTNRTELGFSGNIFEPNLFYRVSGNFDRDGGAFELEDAYMGYAFDSGLILIGGQLRMPVLWEDLLNDKYSLAVDQSVVNAVFRQDRSQGVWLHYKADDWRMWFGFSDGVRTENTDYTGAEADWAFTTRWELKLGGDWSQFDSFSSAPGSEFATKLALATHWQGGPHGVAGATDATVGAFTGDAMIQGDGWNAFAAGVLFYTELPSDGTTTDYGFLAQGGFFIPDTDFELFARYDAVVPDSDRTNDDIFNTLTAGVNYYLHGQAAKFTLDVQYFIDATSSNDLVSGVAGSDVGDRIGLLPTDSDGEFTIRAQFQLLF